MLAQQRDLRLFLSFGAIAQFTLVFDMAIKHRQKAILKYISFWQYKLIYIFLSMSVKFFSFKSYFGVCTLTRSVVNLLIADYNLIRDCSGISYLEGSIPAMIYV